MTWSDTYNIIQHDTIWYIIYETLWPNIWHNTTQYDMTRYNIWYMTGYISYNMIWRYIWYDMTQSNMTWYNIWYDT